MRGSGRYALLKRMLVSLNTERQMRTPHRFVDMPLDQDVEHRESEISQDLPDLPSEQHPQDMILSLYPDPAPPHRHL